MSTSDECCGWLGWAELAGMGPDGSRRSEAMRTRSGAGGPSSRGQDAGTFTIGELARRAGVNIQTVRYYERRGLLDTPARRESGYREYDESAAERLHFIRHAQELGFTLAEITELLALRLDPGTTAGAVKSRAEEKIAQIDRKLRDLTRLREALTHLAGRCRGGHGPAGDCPLLEALGPLGEPDGEHLGPPARKKIN